jgi:hypothetical protein
MRTSFTADSRTATNWLSAFMVMNICWVAGSTLAPSRISFCMSVSSGPGA